MKHRHLNSEIYTAPAVDDIIARGKLSDWIQLRDALHDAVKHGNSGLSQIILQVCQQKLQDPTQQRYYLWNLYVKRQLS